MKNLIIAAVTLVALTFGVSAQQTTDSLTNKMDTTTAKVNDNITIDSKGIATCKIKTSAVCEMCKETIEKAMAYERGVKDSNLDVDSKVLTVRFDTKKTTLDKIRTAVILSGYDADSIPADTKAYDNLHACCKKDSEH